MVGSHYMVCVFVCVCSCVCVCMFVCVCVAACTRSVCSQHARVCMFVCDIVLTLCVLVLLHRGVPGSLPHSADCDWHPPVLPGAVSGAADPQGQHRGVELHQPSSGGHRVCQLCGESAALPLPLPLWAPHLRKRAKAQTHTREGLFCMHTHTEADKGQ